MEYDTRKSSAYDAVVSLLQDLDIMLCCHGHDLGSGKSFSSRFLKQDIQIMYDNLSLMKSLLADFSGRAYHKKLKSSLGTRMANSVYSWKHDIFSRIADTVDNTKKCVVSKVQSLIGLNIDKRATAQSTVLNLLLRFSNEEEHFVMYDVVVLLLHDLELTLSSDRYIFDSEQYLFSASMKEDFQIMYDNLSKMDSLLFDFSGQSYDNKLMNSMENWICFVAYRGLDYIDSWPQSFIPVPNIEKHPTAVGCDSALMSDFMMHQQTDRIESLNKELKRIRDNREVIRKPVPVRGTTKRGIAFSSALNWFRKTPRGGSNLVDHGKHLLTIPDHPEPDIEYQISSSIDGEAQFYCRNLRQITRNIEFVNNQLRKIHDDTDILQKSTQSLESTAFTGQEFTVISNSHRTSNEVGKLVGFEQDLLIMLGRLDGYPPKLQVLAIIGMGGIGKTTFSRSLYDNPRLKHHFDIRAWYTISQHYQLREVLIGLLQCIIGSNTEIYERSNEELKEKLYRSLEGKRYLIVLDDVWDKKVWDDIKMIFPDDKSGSRIILTSRLIGVATHASPGTPYHLRSLDEDRSWELLCSKISVEEWVRNYCQSERK